MSFGYVIPIRGNKIVQLCNETSRLYKQNEIFYDVLMKKKRKS